ncbi:MAG: glycosyltransferase [Bacteroidota bacterium]
MNIAFVLHTFPVVSETFIVNQICALIDAGHDVNILALERGDHSIVHEKVHRYGLLDKASYLETEPKSKWRRLKFLVKTLKGGSKTFHGSRLVKALNVFRYGKNALSLHVLYRMQWFLRKDAYEVIHCHFASMGLYISRLKRDGLLSSETLVTSVHGSDIHPGKVADYRNRYPLLFETMDLITYNSIYTLNILREVHADTSKMRLLPVGLDTASFVKSQAAIAPTTVQILFCGRLVPFKGPDLAIEILRSLVERGNDVHLTLVGTGPLLETVSALIETYGLREHVSLKGAMSQDDIKRLMDNSHLFLLPGIHEEPGGRAENQGLVIQEAQAMKLPVVVSDAGGMKYGLVDGETGFVVKEKDVPGFVEKLELLINDTTLRTEMGDNGRAYVIEHFDAGVLCEQLVVYYRESIRN